MGILQARILECVTYPFSRGTSWPRNRSGASCTAGGFFTSWATRLSPVVCYSAAAAKSLQSCPTLWDPIDGSPPGSAVPGILQARTLEWVAVSFSNAWKWKVKVKSPSHVQLSVTPWTAAHQAPPSMGFFRQEYWSGVPLPSPYVTLLLIFAFLNCLLSVITQLLRLLIEKNSKKIWRYNGYPLLYFFVSLLFSIFHSTTCKE